VASAPLYKKCMSEANTLKGIQGGQREPRVTTE
jgi:hypothetical protein